MRLLAICVSIAADGCGDIDAEALWDWAIAHMDIVALCALVVLVVSLLCLAVQWAREKRRQGQK